MFQVKALQVFALLLLCTSGLALAQDGLPPGPPAGRAPLVECVEGEDIPCVEIVDEISDVVGIWRRYFEGGTAMAFTVYTEDGEFGITLDPQGVPNIAGTITFEAGLALIAASEDSPAPPECIAPGTYELRVIRLGNQPVALTYFQIEDACPGRIGDLTEPMLYYTVAEVAELDPDVDALAQPLIPCSDQMDSDVAAYPCDEIVTSSEDVAGVWKQYMGNPNLAAPMGMGHIRYLEDGRYFLADTPENTMAIYENYPYGTISVNESIVTITVDAQTLPACETADYHLRVIKFGDQPVALTYTIVTDDCLPRRGDLGEALIWIITE
ncbi:MAG: hypothetical protein RLP44_08305 [Aggregatilineales bacterium]